MSFELFVVSGVELATIAFCAVVAFLVIGTIMLCFIPYWGRE